MSLSQIVAGKCQYNELLNCLSSLKEYDVNLTTKIKLLDSHLVKLNNDSNKTNT